MSAIGKTGPLYYFSEERFLPKGDPARAFWLVLRDDIGTTNKEPFRGFRVGECLLIGANPSKWCKTGWIVELRFAACLSGFTFVVNGNLMHPYAAGNFDALFDQTKGPVVL